MKKIITCIMTIMLATTLSGCSLAKDDEYYDLKYLNEDTDYYIPSSIEFKMYQGANDEKELDVSDYFYVSFNCSNQTVWDNCVAVNIGKSIESSGTTFNTESNTIDGVEQPEIHTATIDLTFYATEESELWIYHTVVLENEDGETKSEDSCGVNFSSGVSLSGTSSGQMEDGTSYTINYTFNYEAIDELKLVTIKQYDTNDVLLVETVVSKDNILEYLILEDNTQYYFIIEDYVDREGTLYQERTYKDTTTAFYYLYKYTNTDGFLNGDRLIVE